MSILDTIRGLEKNIGNSWKPEKSGDCIAGEAVSDLHDVDTKYGKCPAIDIRSEEDGQVYTVLAGTVIERELKNQRAQMGDKIGFKFLGRKNHYNDFLVLFQKNGHEPGKSSSEEEGPPSVKGVERSSG